MRAPPMPSHIHIRVHMHIHTYTLVHLCYRLVASAAECTHIYTCMYACVDMCICMYSPPMPSLGGVSLRVHPGCSWGAMIQEARLRTDDRRSGRRVGCSSCASSFNVVPTCMCMEMHICACICVHMLRMRTRTRICMCMLQQLRLRTKSSSCKQAAVLV